MTGHPTLSRPVTRLISRPDIEVVSVAGRRRTWPPTRAGSPGTLDSVPVAEGADDADWVDCWQGRRPPIVAAVDQLADASRRALPLQVAAEVAAAVTPEALLVVGSSQPVRDLDLMAVALPGRPASARDRQPRPRRHRRHCVDGDRRGARSTLLASPGLSGRSDLPARRERAHPRTGRAPAGHLDRGRQRRRRRDLLDARAGRPGLRVAHSSGSSQRRTECPSPPLRGDGNRV